MLKAIACLFLGLAVVAVWKEGLSDVAVAMLIVSAVPVAIHALLSSYRVELTSNANAVIVAPWRRKRTIPLGSVVSAIVDWDRGVIRPNILIEYVRDGKKRRTRMPLGLFSLHNLRRLIRLFDAALPDDEAEES